jgi:hypothetical protein
MLVPGLGWLNWLLFFSCLHSWDPIRICFLSLILENSYSVFISRDRTSRVSCCLDCLVSIFQDRIYRESFCFGCLVSISRESCYQSSLGAPILTRRPMILKMVRSEWNYFQQIQKIFYQNSLDGKYWKIFEVKSFSKKNDFSWKHFSTFDSYKKSWTTSGWLRLVTFDSDLWRR